MKEKLAILILFTACTQSPYPITVQTMKSKDGQKPFLMELSTGQDQKPIPENTTIQITGPLKDHKWPAIYKTDTGFIYPKFLDL